MGAVCYADDLVAHTALAMKNSTWIEPESYYQQLSKKKGFQASNILTIHVKLKVIMFVCALQLSLNRVLSAILNIPKNIIEIAFVIACELKTRDRMFLYVFVF